MTISKTTTIAKVAEMAGVSIATVSRIINQTGYVKPETRQKVLDAMKELNFHAKEAEESPITNTRAILVCVPNFDNPFNSGLIQGIQAITVNRNYRAFYYEARDFFNVLSDYTTIMKHYNFCGILLVHNVTNPDLLTELRLRYPVVMCSEHCNPPDISFVSIDDFRAAQNAVNFLATVGRKKIALINSSLKHNYAKHREKGYKAALLNLGLSYRPEWVAHISDINFDMAVAAASGIITSSERPDAFFCVSDVFAAAVIKAAKDNHLRIPEDIAVVGFDNIDLSTMTIPPLTTIKQPSFQIGQQACEMLLNQIENPSITPKHVILDTELIVRGST